MGAARDRAMHEMAFCEAILAKGGLSVLTDTLRDAPDIATWTHYPDPDVFDPQSGAQWFYHCHPADDPDSVAEHGHFHCFVRPRGADSPIHHLAAVGVDPYGRLLRLFTVNQWVVGDDWLDAEPTIGLLEKFDVHMPRPSYLVNRWLTAVFAAYEPEIAELIRERDRVLDTHIPEGGGPAREDRALEVVSELVIHGDEAPSRDV